MVTLSTRRDFDFTVHQMPRLALLKGFAIDWQHRLTRLKKGHAG